MVIAEDVDGEAWAGLVVNKIRGTFKSVAAQGPGLRRSPQGDPGRHRSTGGQVISETVGLSLETTDIDMPGKARTVTVTKDDTTTARALAT